IHRPAGTHGDAALGVVAGRTGRMAQAATSTSATSGAADWARGRRLLMELLGEIGLLAELADEPELDLEPIDVFLFALEDVLEQVARRIVALGDAEGDPAIEQGDG